MSGINSSTGLISGIDYNALITQLLQIEAQPKTLVQRRIVELQTDQAAFLDLNSRLGALKTAAGKFRTSNIFKSAAVATTNANVLTGSASPGAALGGFSFVVDRTVSTQQVLGRAFADRDVSGTGATSITFESARGRLDSDTRLADLNGGAGVERGSIVVTDHAGHSATIDLSRAATVGEVLDKLNNNTTVRIKARTDGDKLIIEDNSGVAGTLRIEDGVGYNTATSLGIAGSATNASIDGQSVYYIGNSTSLQSFNDGNGIRFNSAVGAVLNGINPTNDFTIKTRAGDTIGVDIGDIWETVDGKLTKTSSAVSDFASLKARIESQTQNKVTVETTADGRGVRLVDTTAPTGANNFEVIDISGAARDLRIVGSTNSDSIDGVPVLAGLNSTLTTNLGGGAGLASGEFSITTRDGSQHNFSVSTDSSIDALLREINDLTGGDVTATIGQSGVGIRLTDNTGGTGNFIVDGAGATALGVATGAAGVGAASVDGTRLQHRYISESTLLSSLNDGKGVGTGTFEIKGPNGRAVIDIGTDSRNLADVIQEINSKNIGVRARINDNGDGLLIEKSPTATGVSKIEITDLSGGVARGLNIAGAAANNTDKNFVDGTFERKVELTAADTLNDIVTKINNAKPGVSASVIRDSSGANPYRLKFTASQTGQAGAFTVDVAGADLGLSTIAEARNARLFYGSDDPATAVLLESSTNTFDGVVDGLTITAKAASSDPVTLTVSQDTDAVESAVNDFVSAFNDLAARLDKYTSYDDSTKVKGTLLGDSTANDLRRAIYDQLLKPARGTTGAYKYLSQVGVKVASGGTLQVDSDKLRAAIAADPQAVADLFTARTQDTPPTRTPVEGLDGVFVVGASNPTFSSLGVAEQFVQMVEHYTSTVGGVLARRNTSLDTEIAAQNRRIDDLDARLESRRTFLTQQFASLETTLANLQRQQSSLGQIGASVK